MPPYSVVLSLDCGFSIALNNCYLKWLIVESQNINTVAASFGIPKCVSAFHICLVSSLHIPNLQPCWQFTLITVLQYLAMWKWNCGPTVLETADWFWQTRHRSTWPSLCAQLSWNIITWSKRRGWCNRTNKAKPWCVIVAVMLIPCRCSNWNPERIFPKCAAVVFRPIYFFISVGLESTSAEADLLSSVAFYWLACMRGLFFGGCLLMRPHRNHASMTHGTVSVCLSVGPSAQSWGNSSWCWL